ncbi:MAG: DNA polymerase III subunit delta' [Hydrogenophilales bacterium 28-61-23]|nr:MAG: DNA polymerase III subunit delta' [Hydrogenophilales bacterium 28-61-23]
MIHPWNRALFQQLSAERERLPHALLLHGPAGIGKRDFGLALAQWVLCETPSLDGACGVCDACNWFVQGNHPDFRFLEPKEEESDESGKVTKKASKEIKVEQVREITDYLCLSAHRGGWRTAVIHPAEFMNAAAANALLKTLEEPPPRVLLILVSHQPGRLLPTVRSRCRKVAVGLPAAPAALAWMREAGIVQPEDILAEAGGAPLAAIGFAEPERSERREAFLDALSKPGQFDVCAIAEAYKPQLTEAWGWLVRWVHDALSLRLAGSSRYFPAHADIVARLGRQADLAGLLAFERELAVAGRWLRHPLNPTLLLESWLIRYVEVVNKP